MASKETKCVRCGKPFYEVIIATAFAGIIAAYLFITFFLNLLATSETFVEEIFGDYFPIGLEYIAISFVILIIFMPIWMAGVVPALKKRYQSGHGLACSECKKALIAEAKDAEVKKQQAAEAQAYAHMTRVDEMEKNDLWMGKIIRSWKKDHPNQLPEEAMLSELSMARNMEKAGNYEKAALILEKYHLWEEAGRVRKLDDQTIVKHITVDMNELIDQVSTKGLAIPYKCQSCGASITIDKDSRKEGLKFCSYCGTTYNIDDMTKIIQQALD